MLLNVLRAVPLLRMDAAKESDALSVLPGLPARSVSRSDEQPLIVTQLIGLFSCGAVYM